MVLFISFCKMLFDLFWTFSCYMACQYIWSAPSLLSALFSLSKSHELEYRSALVLASGSWLFFFCRGQLSMVWTEETKWTVGKEFVSREGREITSSHVSIVDNMIKWSLGSPTSSSKKCVGVRFAVGSSRCEATIAIQRSALAVQMCFWCHSASACKFCWRLVCPSW